MRYVFGTLFITFCLNLTAQKEQNRPVSWSFQLVKLNDSEYEFRAVADIQNKWNIYSKEMSNDGPIPTSVTFESIVGGTMQGELSEKCKIVKSYDELFEMEVLKIKDNATYTQKFNTSAPTGSISGFVNYMCCDNEKCLPPTNVPFELKF